MTLSAPERIWAVYNEYSYGNEAYQWVSEPYEHWASGPQTEYVRKDVFDAAVAESKAEGMREAARIAAHRYAVCEDAFAKGLGPEERHCALEAKKIESDILAAIPVTK